MDNNLKSLLFTVYSAGFEHGVNEGAFPKHGTAEAFNRLIKGESPLDGGSTYAIKEKVSALSAQSSNTSDKWLMPANGEYPELGVEVIGYNKAWEEENYNPNGTRICFINEAAGEWGYWIMAVWNNDQDCWDQYMCKDISFDPYFHAPPSHWQPKPTKPI